MARLQTQALMWNIPVDWVAPVSISMKLLIYTRENEQVKEPERYTIMGEEPT